MRLRDLLCAVHDGTRAQAEDDAAWAEATSWLTVAWFALGHAAAALDGVAVPVVYPRPELVGVRPPAYPS